MKSLATLTSLGVVCLSSLLASVPSVASTAIGIQRCETGDGTAVYTDGTCDAHGALSSAMPEELVLRIAREETQYPVHLLDQGRTVAIAGRRSVADGCARSARQLAGDLAGAMAQDDVNRVAESFHWAGVSQRQGQAMLEGLRAFTNRQVYGGRYYGAFVASPDMQAPVGRMRLMLGDEGRRRALQLDVHRYAGCYFASL